MLESGTGNLFIACETQHEFWKCWQLTVVNVCSQRRASFGEFAMMDGSLALKS